MARYSKGRRSLLNTKLSQSHLIVEDIMQSNILTCSPETTIKVAANRMRSRNISSIIVVENGLALGIWTEADCRKIDFTNQAQFDVNINMLMSSPVMSVKQDLTVNELATKFRSHNVRHFIVVNEQSLPLGIVSQTDVIKNQGIEHYLQSRLVSSSYKKNQHLLQHRSSLSDIAEQMKAYKCSSTLIYHSELKQYGIVTERDLLTLLANGKFTENEAWHYASYPLKTISADYTLYTAYQQLLNNNIRHLAVSDADGEIVGTLSMDNIMSHIELAYIEELHNIVQQRDKALKESKKHLLVAEKIIEASLDGIMITDEKGCIMSVNPAFTRVTGYQEEEVLGVNSKILSSGRHSSEFYQQLWLSILDKGVWQGEIWNKRKNNEIYPQWLTIIEINERVDGNKIFAAIFSDISERKRAEKRIENLAFYDELTHLPNRRLLYDRIEVALATAHRNAEKMALLFVDLDYFKEVNDNFGHRVGDKLLQSIAKRLTENSKEGDTVARIGGDEFTLLLTEMNEVDHICKACHRITEKLRQSYYIEGHTLNITTSIGIAVYPDDGETEEELMKKADIAMYRAKDIGRNSYQLFTPTMNAHSLERSLMQSHLRLALDNNELVLNYQVQKNSVIDKVIGVEALLRWSNPVIGEVSPAQFIPLAEEIGLITEVDDWVLLHACKQRKSWLDQGVECGRVAVNISPLHFHQGDLVASVKYALAKAELPAELIEIEVTEGCFIKQMENATCILIQLRAMGIKIALDDFGTGFSSLSYLTTLPIDTLKIDASFITQVPHNFRESQITSAIITLAQNLNLDLVAEGVETHAQKLFLLDRGCDVMQGYFYSKPVSAELLPNMVQQLCEHV